MSDGTEQETVEVPAWVAAKAAQTLKNAARVGYKNSATERADALHSLGRKLNDDTGLAWSDLDDVSLYDDPKEVLER